jgi:DNA-binding CsgD family transcriptional regulator
MNFRDAYAEAATAADGISNQPQLDAFIRNVLRIYGLKHAVYYAPETPGVSPVRFVSYDPAWVARYFEADYLKIDPVVTAGFTSLLPVDWKEFDRRPPRVKQLFGEALEFGVGHQGLTFPIHGPAGESGLFTVSSDLPDKEWEEARKTYIRDLHILAHTVHAKSLQIVSAKTPDYKNKLTARQRECLTWCAVGKTGEEIAEILGISEGVVRIHLQSAQHKLNCLNRAHTVAKAIAYKLIHPVFG